MKKLLLILTLTLLFASGLKAQWQQQFDNTDTTHRWRYVIPGLNRIIFWDKDTVFSKDFHARIYYPNFISRNDQKVQNILWLNNLGELMNSSTDSLYMVKLSDSTIKYVTPFQLASQGYLTAEVDGSITNEIELPSQFGNSDKVLSTNGTTCSWINPPTPSVTIDTIVNTRLFNTAYRMSTTNMVEVRLSAQVSCNLSLSGGQSGQIILEKSANGTSNWIQVGIIPASNTGTLTVGLNTTQISGGQISTTLPIGWYWRLRTNNITGTPTYTFFGGEKEIR
jgi:hypothetical protein